MYDTIAFAKIGWYKNYNYYNEDHRDLPRGRHEYIKRVGDAHERLTFSRCKTERMVGMCIGSENIRASRTRSRKLAG
jgi:hypothetical protein